MTTEVKNRNSQPHIAVLGLGYVGCVSAACFAQMGYRVTGIDRDAIKIASIMTGHAPFFEPGLEELVSTNVKAGRLTVTQNIAAIHDADIAFVCVGTPSERNGNIGLDQLRRVVQEMAQTVARRSKPLVIAIRSTVFPGTCEDLLIPAFAGHKAVSVVSHPEFLREGTAVKDFMAPSLIVIGGEEPQAVDRIASLYASLPTDVSRVSLRTAEMIKYACNAYHAVKIAFANEIGSLSARLAVDPGEVMTTLCQDTKLNISSTYLKPGFAFGGSCLPKDLRALTYRAASLDLAIPLLESAIPSNQQHLSRAQEAILALPARRLGLIGLAFKENTDDLRESPVVSLLETLIGKGRELRVFDSHIQLNEIYGRNKNFLLQQIPHIGRLLDNNVEETLAWADHLLVAQKLSPELAAKVQNSGLPITDLTHSSLAYITEFSRTWAAAV
jgi:GDP-mannose 6-dehydrogenase